MSRQNSRPPKPPASTPERRSPARLRDDANRLTEENDKLRLTVEALFAREAMLQAVLDALPVWISVTDSEYRYRFVNRALLQARQATLAEMLGKRSTEVPDPMVGYREVIVAADREVLTSGHSVEVPSFPVRMPDGQERLRRLVKFPLRDDDGNVNGVVGWSEDISEAARAAEALEIQRQLLRTVIDVVPFPLSSVDAEGRLRMVNPAWCEMAGCTAEEAIGLTVEQVESIPIASRTQMFHDTLAMIQNRVPRSRRQITLDSGEGSPRHLVVSKAIVLGPNNTAEGVVTGVVDVTELRRSEQMATLARQRLIDAMEALPALLFLYDADERLVHANSLAHDYFPHLGPTLRPGATFEDILSASLPDAATAGVSGKEWFQQRLQQFRHPPERFEVALNDGRTLMGLDRRTSEAGTISIRVDITEQKRLQRELEQRERQIQADLALAADLQRAILRPVQAPPFLAVAWHSQPCSPVSGDLYHASPEPDGAWRFFLGDATGHGVAAAFLTILMQAGLKDVPTGTPAAALLANLNQELLQYELDGLFVSGICVRIDPDGRAELSNAGHPPAIVLQREQNRPGLTANASFPLGWFAEAEYVSIALQLDPGDTLLLYTDGLTEWTDADGLQFGDQQVRRVALRHREQPPARLVEHVLDAARNHARGAIPSDDLTVFALTYLGPAAA